VPEEEKQERLKLWRKKDTEFSPTLAADDPEYELKLYELMDPKVNHLLQILGQQDPQIELNGFRNVWIAKPNCTQSLTQFSRAAGASAASTTSTTSRTTVLGALPSS
jgi:hypothetical protein